MTRVICINSYRKKKRKTFVDQNGDRLDSFIKNFIRNHLTIDFHSITQKYLSECQHNQSQESWDYLDFRDALRDALAKAIGKEIRSELLKTKWFDENVISNDEVIDRCLSVFILQDWAAIS